MFEKIKEAVIRVEMENCIIGDIEILKFFDEAEIIEFNKMGCPYWWEVDECIDYYTKGKNYNAFVKLIL